MKSNLCLTVALLAIPILASAQTKPVVVFEDHFADARGWTHDSGMKAQAATRDGRACLHIVGRQARGWTFAGTRQFALKPGGKYRFSAWVLVEKLEPAYYSPGFKIEWAASKPGGGWQPKEIGRVFTEDQYNYARGGWQELTFDFECPKDVDGGSIGFMKFADKSLVIDVWLADVSVREIDETVRDAELRLSPVPAALAAAAGKHPHLYLTPQRLADLKTKIQSEPYRSLFEKVKVVADRALAEHPPKYQLKDPDDSDEQLYQRPVGNNIPHLAIVYLLTGDKKYLDGAKEWMLASASYPTWGIKQFENNDLAAGHQLYGMALGYDWLCSALDDETRAAVRKCLVAHGQIMFDKLKSHNSDLAWWHNAYLQNHQYINLTGLAAAGMALYGEQDGADQWVAITLATYRKTMASLGTDGASHEGTGYWSYGVEHMLKYMDLAKDLLGVDLFKDSAWFKNTAAYYGYSLLPEKSWTRSSSLMSFADSPRHNWYGPDYSLRKLAHEYSDGHAQYWAQEVDKANLAGSEARFLNLLWFDPAVKPLAPTEPFRYFDDMGIVFMRSGWDGNENTLAFKCGPFIGHHGLKTFTRDPGGGHGHPDENSLQLFACGDWLLTDDGYAPKYTEHHNTLMVNGLGQFGITDGSTISLLLGQKNPATMLMAKSGKDFDYAVGDATAAYDPKAGLKKFLRHVIYLKPSCYVIIDELEAAEPSDFQLLFHSDFPFEQQADGAFQTAGKNGKLKITPMGLQEVAAKAGTQTTHRFAHEEGGPRSALLTLSNKDKSAKAAFVTFLETRPADKPFVAKVQLTGEHKDRLEIQDGDKTWRFKLNWDRQDQSQPLLDELQP